MPIQYLGMLMNSTVQFTVEISIDILYICNTINGLNDKISIINWEFINVNFTHQINKNGWTITHFPTHR